MTRSVLRSFFPGRSAALREMLALAEKVLPHDSSVLLLGETGAGKDRLAQALHAGGSRKQGPFVRIDCAALPLELFEAEVFGYEKGAFTDAKERRTGRFEAASGGTLYLDEITALDPSAQAKLLRVLEQRRITRLGGGAEIRIDVRVVASTSLERRRMVDAVRPDLLYRLDVFAIHLPSLRDRREDLLILVRQILRELKVEAILSDEAAQLLLQYSWPGNVRELRNVLERASILAVGAGAIAPVHLPESIRNAQGLLSRAAHEGWTLEELEASYIRQVLDSTRGNSSRAAAILGIHRKTLLEKRRKYRIAVEGEEVG